MKREGFYIGVDIGAGLGAKIAVFSDAQHQLASSLLRNENFGSSVEQMTDAIAEQIRRTLAEAGMRLDDVLSVGIVTPGLLKSDGSYRLAANIPFLNGQNLRSKLEDAIGLPVGIENDANAGGLAEWSVLQTDLLYWVFGGGWGGAWIARDGSVQFPSLDWDGDDASLHYTNEPGYAIPLDKLMLRTTFYQFGASYDRFERILLEDLQPPDGKILGPCGSEAHLRAEMILSGSGRCRLFRTIVGDDDFYERFLDIHETSQMTDPSVAGQHISKLSAMRVEAAVNTDRLFGQILAEATRIMIKQARQNGLPEGVPICIGGRPRYALPYFGPSAQGRLGAMGIMSYLRPSVIDERGSNANLVGAVVLAQRTYAQRQRPVRRPPVSQPVK
jgi:hypothetical protein